VGAALVESHSAICVAGARQPLVTDAELGAIPVRPHDLHGEWNYTVSPPIVNVIDGWPLAEVDRFRTSLRTASSSPRGQVGSGDRGHRACDLPEHPGCCWWRP
jgi:hypothetical protein